MQEQVRLTSWLMYASVVASFCCIGQYGYHVGVLAAPTKYIQDFYNQSYTERYGEITQDIMDWLWAVTASSYLIGGALGAIAAPSISDIMGRKYGLLLVNFLPLSAAVMSGCSRIANNFELIIMSRTVNGVYGGIAFGITPMFLAEISPIKYRGAVGSSQKVFLALCILLAQILGIFVLNTEDNWHILLSMTGVISAIHLLLFPPCPDSPRWLVITDFNTKSAKRAIKKYYGTSDVDWVVDEINREHREELTEEKVGVVGLFTNPNYRRPLLISVTIMSSIQLCGIPALYQYAGFVFEMIWPNDPDAVSYAILGIGLVELFASFIAIFLVDRFGRRPLILYNFAAMVLLNGIIALSLNLANPEKADAWAYISMICIFASIFFFSIGPATVYFIIVPELWSQSTRPAAVSLGVQVQWWSGVLITFLFPYMQSGIGAYMFLIFMVIMIYYTAFAYFLVPETKQRSFEAISTGFRRKPRKRNED